MYIGLDIGGTSAKIGLLNKDQILFKQEIQVNFDHYNTPIIETVKSGIHNFIESNALDMSVIHGIGVSATGQIDVKNGVVIGGGGHIKNWIKTNIKDELEKEFNLKVSVINDADAMIIAEHRYGHAKDYRNIIGITIGTGIGGGIVVENKLLLGHKGIAGEIGHMVLNSAGQECPCGNIGCYETYASMSALILRVKDSLDSQEIPYEAKAIDGKYIFEEIELGNKEFKNILNNWIKDIALGIVSLVHIFNPEIIIIGGGVSSQKELFLKPLIKVVKKHCLPEFSKDLKIVTAKYENDSGMIGGVSYLEGE